MRCGGRCGGWGMADKDVDTKEARGAGLPIRPVDENAANKLMRYVPYWG